MMKESLNSPWMELCFQEMEGCIKLWRITLRDLSETAGGIPNRRLVDGKNLCPFSGWQAASLHFPQPLRQLYMQARLSVLGGVDALSIDGITFRTRFQQHFHRLVKAACSRDH